MTTTHPTGRKRYRAHHRLFRATLMVLQIELREIGDIETVGGSLDVARNFWRDAALEDLTVAVPT